MRKKPFLPKSYKYFVIWIQNFARKIIDHATTLDIDAATVTQITNDAYLCGYALQVTEIYKHELSETVKFRKLLYNGDPGLVLGYPVAPVMPVLPGPPVPKAGVVQRVSKVAKEIKLHPNYTEAIGMDLGIIGSEQVIDWSEQVPVLKLKLQSNSVRIDFDKGLSDGIRIYSRRGDETEWTFLDVDANPPYYDKRKNLVTGKGETREYKAIFILKDQEAGMESAIYPISVRL